MSKIESGAVNDPRASLVGLPELDTLMTDRENEVPPVPLKTNNR